MIFKISIQITCVSGMTENFIILLCFLSTSKYKKSIHNKKLALQHQFTEHTKKAYNLGVKNDFRNFC